MAKLLIVLAATMVLLSPADGEPMDVCYLTENTIRVVHLSSLDSQAIETSRWNLSTGQPGETFAGLSCVGSGEVLMHRSQLERLLAEPKVVTYLVKGNVHTKTWRKIFTPDEIALSFPVLSPSKLEIAAYGTGGRLVILATANMQLQIYRENNLGNPHAWSSDGRYVYLTGLGNNDDVRKVRFDTLHKTFKDLGPGRAPSPSPSGRRLAFISDDRSELHIENSNSESVRVFSGFFQSTASWIDEDRLLVVTATGPYQDSLTIAEIDAGKLTRLDLRHSGEIQGACILKP